MIDPDRYLIQIEDEPPPARPDRRPSLGVSNYQAAARFITSQVRNLRQHKTIEPERHPRAPSH